MIFVRCQKCDVLREGIVSEKGIVCLRCQTPSELWHELMLDPPTEDLALDPNS